MRSGDRAGPEPACEVERRVDRGELERGAVALAAGADADLVAEGRGERFRDPGDGLDLVGVQAARAAAVLRRAALGGGRRARTRLGRADRPALADRVAGEAAAGVVVVGQQQRAAVALAE